MLQPAHTPVPKPAKAAMAKLRAWLGLLGLVMALLVSWIWATPVQANMATAQASAVNNPLEMSPHHTEQASNDTPVQSSAQGADPDDMESDLHGFTGTTDPLVLPHHRPQAASAQAEFLNCPLRRPPRHPADVIRV